MRARTRNAIRSVATSGALGLLIFSLLAVYAPDSVALSPNNYGWNGVQGVFSTYQASILSVDSSATNGSVLVFTQPSVGFSTGDAAVVRLHLERGGDVLVADNSGVANSLLKGLDSGILIQSGLSVRDPVYNWKDETLPTAVVPTYKVQAPKAVAGISGIALNRPSPLSLSGHGAVPIAVTSPLSYAVSPQGTDSVGAGPFVVAVSERIGNGTLTVVGGSQFLLNSGLAQADNKGLIQNLFGGRRVFFDASHWAASPLASSTAQARAVLDQFFSEISGFPGRYIFSLVLVGLALVLSPEPSALEAEETPGIFNRELERSRRRD